MATEIRLPADALDVDYMKAIRLYLNTIAHWPHETFGPRTMRTRLLSLYHAILLSTCMYTETSAILLARKRMKLLGLFDMGQDYLCILMSFVMITRLTLILQKRYCLLIKKFVCTFHLVKHEHASEFAAREYRWIDKLCRIATIIILIECVSGQVMFNVVPFYENYQAGLLTDREYRPQNQTFKHSINYYFVIDQYRGTILGYSIVALLNFYISYVCGVLFCGLDLLIYVMIFHTMGHFNILVNKMRCFPRPMQKPGQTAEHSERQYNKEAADILKDLIEHDLLIKEFMNDTSDTFGITLCFCFLFHQVCGCIMLLEISPMTPEALSRYGPLTIVLWNQLIQMSVIFELISSKSDTLPDEVYALPWELMDSRNRKTVLLFLRNAQPPRGLKAGGLVSVGVLTMSTIMKNSLSYFLMLKTLGKN